MNSIDLIVIITIMIGFILGFKDGLLRKLIGLIGLVLAIILASLYKAPVGTFIENTLGIEYYLAEIVAGIIIFFAVILIFTLIKRIVHPFDKINNLINQIVGGVVGAVQLLFFLSAVFLLLNIFGLPSKRSKDKSAFYKYTYELIPVTIDYLNNYTPEAKEVIEEYINDQDTTG